MQTSVFLHSTDDKYSTILQYRLLSWVTVLSKSPTILQRRTFKLGMIIIYNLKQLARFKVMKLKLKVLGQCVGLGWGVTVLASVSPDPSLSPYRAQYTQSA